jgi:hypothetical protein
LLGTKGKKTPQQQERREKREKQDMKRDKRGREEIRRKTGDKEKRTDEGDGRWRPSFKASNLSVTFERE